MALALCVDAIFVICYINFMKTCSIDGCKKCYYSKGFCKKHYDKNRRHGDPLFEEIFLKDEECTIDGCGHKRHAKGMCNKHYVSYLRQKDPLRKEKQTAWCLKWRKENPVAFAKHQAKYREKHRKELASYYVLWRKENKESFNAYVASRKKRFKRAMPKWVDLKEIEFFYKNRPNGFHVDHIVPINGKNVSGLHVLWNLQYLPALENLKKSNKF